MITRQYDSTGEMLSKVQKKFEPKMHSILIRRATGCRVRCKFICTWQRRGFVETQMIMLLKIVQQPITLICDNFPREFVTQPIDGFICFTLIINSSNRNGKLFLVAALKTSSVFHFAQCEIVRLDHQKPSKRFVRKWALFVNFRNVIFYYSLTLFCAIMFNPSD